MKYLLLLLTTLALLIASFSISPNDEEVKAIEETDSVCDVHTEKNSVYYWKTKFHLDSADLSFVRKHNIGRIYLRMFDVSKEVYPTSLSDRAVPNATVRIDYEDYELLKDSLLDLEFVPVIYITLDALKAMSEHEGVLAANIVTRIKNMCSYNSIPNVNEIQLDCDWTNSTRQSFFNLCDSVKHEISKLDLPWRISSTIRLHQLSQDAPPVNSGVLMVYNTGSFTNPDASNSIIDASDVKPYLRYLSSYPLHLDIAYPTYSWQLLFHNRSFVGLINNLDLTDEKLFARLSDNIYKAKKDIPYKNMVIHEGDEIREETSAFNDVNIVRTMIEKRYANHQHSNILYHLDLKNLNKYSDYEIDILLSTY